MLLRRRDLRVTAAFPSDVEAIPQITDWTELLITQLGPLLPAGLVSSANLLFHPHVEDQLALNILCAHLEAVFEFVQHARELFVTIGARVKSRIKLIKGISHHIQSC